MRENIRKRIEALEAGMPRAIVLTLNDGATLHHPGPPLKFAMEALAQIEKRGPLVVACTKTVSAIGCGLLYQLVSSIAKPLMKEGSRNAKRRRSKAISRRRRAHGA